MLYWWRHLGWCILLWNATKPMVPACSNFDMNWLFTLFYPFYEHSYGYPKPEAMAPNARLHDMWVDRMVASTYIHTYMHAYRTLSKDLLLPWSYIKSFHCICQQKSVFDILRKRPFPQPWWTDETVKVRGGLNKWNDETIREKEWSWKMRKFVPPSPDRSRSSQTLSCCVKMCTCAISPSAVWWTPNSWPKSELLRLTTGIMGLGNPFSMGFLHWSFSASSIVA